MDYKDYYQVLGVARTASADEIRSAYRKLALKHHPDRVAHLGEEFQRSAAEKFKKVQKAWERIEKEQTKHANLSLPLGYDEDEKRQLSSDRRHWDRRLTELEKELSSEPDRIRRSFEVRATRLEPVGLAYLWPVSG